jgi:ubiquitin-like-conjugating enzyme ATG10
LYSLACLINGSPIVFEIDGTIERTKNRLTESLLKFGVRYMRITKRITTPTKRVVDESKGEVHEIEDELEVEIEDDDPEALIVQTTTAKRQDLNRVVWYDVVYSPSYQVPILYLTFATASTNKSIPLPAADEIYEMLVPQGFKAPMRDVGVMGALSMAEHPITGMPAYFVHPCRTQEALAPLMEEPSHKVGSEPAVECLLLWFGVIGASVGLSVPVNLAKLLAERRGEATKLGRC